MEYKSILEKSKEHKIEAWKLLVATEVEYLMKKILN